MYNDSSSLCLIKNNNTTGQMNYSNLASACKKILSRKFNNYSASNQINDHVVDFEEMLMETHGCSAYHFHLHQQKNETEF